MYAVDVCRRLQKEGINDLKPFIYPSVGRWFPPGTPDSTTNMKLTFHHDHFTTLYVLGCCWGDNPNKPDPTQPGSGKVEATHVFEGLSWMVMGRQGGLPKSSPNSSLYLLAISSWIRSVPVTLATVNDDGIYVSRTYARTFSWWRFKATIVAYIIII